MKLKNNEQYEQFETDETELFNQNKSHRKLKNKRIVPFIAITGFVILILFFYSSFPLKLNFLQKNKKNDEKNLDDYITAEFRIQYKTEPGEYLYIYGDTDTFGNWTEPKFKLIYSKGDIWTKRILLPITDKLIQFKFAVQKKTGPVLEEGNNRILTTKDLKGFKVTRFGIYVLDCVWNFVEINFNIHHKLKDRNSFLLLNGGTSLNQIKGNNDSIIMHHNSMIKLQPDDRYTSKGYWTCSIFIKNEKIKNISSDYFYSISNPKGVITRIEKDASRKISLVLLQNKNDTKIPENLVINSNWGILDENLITEIVVYRLGDKNIYIGTSPENEYDFELLSKHKINAVLNILTDEDIKQHNLNYTFMQPTYEKLGISITRYPIITFNQEDLENKLKGAGDTLKKLIDEGKTVYVHSLDFMSRSSATAIIYFVLYENFSVRDAIEYCKKYLHVIVPDYRAINNVAKMNRPGSELDDKTLNFYCQ